MIYIIREPDKTGGREYASAFSAIDACAAWEIATGIQCHIISRMEYSGKEYPADYLTRIARRQARLVHA